MRKVYNGSKMLKRHECQISERRVLKYLADIETNRKNILNCF